MLGATSLLAYYQFAPGRIDHHNVDDRDHGRRGADCGPGRSIERVALVRRAVRDGARRSATKRWRPCFSSPASPRGWGLLDQRACRGRQRASSSASSSTLALIFVATVPPSRWLDDLLRRAVANLVVLAACAGGGFIVVMRNRLAGTWPRQLAVLGAARFDRRRSVRLARARLPCRSDGPGAGRARSDLDRPGRRGQEPVEGTAARRRSAAPRPLLIFAAGCGDGGRVRCAARARRDRFLLLVDSRIRGARVVADEVPRLRELHSRAGHRRVRIALARARQRRRAGRHGMVR